MEEITDVIISLEYCKQIAHIKPRELVKETEMDIKKHRIMRYINILSKTQQSITKFIRYTAKSRQVLIQNIILTYQVIDELIEFYDINLLDIEKMKQIKLNRLQDRLKNDRHSL